MMTNKTLLTEINRFCAEHSMSPSGFGRQFLENANFVFDIENEAYQVKLKTVNKVLAKMKEYKPKEGKKNGK